MHAFFYESITCINVFRNQLSRFIITLVLKFNRLFVVSIGGISRFSIVFYKKSYFKHRNHKYYVIGI